MGQTNPSHGLFPDINIISHPDNHTSHEDRNDANDSRKSLQDETSNNTSESGMISAANSIIKQEGWHDVEAFHNEVRNDRFYLSERYKKRKLANLSDIIYDPNRLSDDSSYDDFSTYNRKVQQEYELREKVEELLRSSDPGGVQIYSEDALKSNYLGSYDVHPRNSKSFKDHFRSGLHRASYNKENKNKPADSIDDTIPSLSTYIIDQTSYRNLVIDETNPSIKRHTTGGTSFLEPSDTYYSQHNKEGWKSRISKYFTKESQYHIQRRLTLRHVQMLSVGPCLSVGFFLTSGRAFTIAGPFGTLLGFSLSGSVILATLLSFTELSALIPLSSGFSGLASRFVEDAFGFALGWTYFFSCLISFPAEAASSTFYLTYYTNLNLSHGTIAGFVTLFIICPIVCNLMSVNLMGEVIFFFGTMKIIVSILMMFVMVLLNSGHGSKNHEQVGFRFWDASKSVGNMTYGLFRPTFDLKDTGTGSNDGIGGPAGRFLALASVVLTSTFAYSGVEMTFLASGEAKDPRKTIPSAIKRTFSTILTIYILSILTVGINIYSGDPRLLSYDEANTLNRSIASDKGVGTHWQLENTCNIRTRIPGTSVDYSSPWVLALQSFGFCTFAAAFNAILIIFTSSAAIASLYNSSRALYSMSVQRKAPYIFQICSKNGVPYVSVIVAGLFSLIAFLAVNESSQHNFSILVNMSSASTSIIWFGLNLSFLRFFYALKKRNDFLSRDDKAYPFKSPLQPYLAFYGLTGCLTFVIFMGFTNFIPGFWDTRSFFSAYGGLMIFCVCYVGYKIIGTSKIQRLDHLDMDTGRREIDRMIWTEHRQCNYHLFRRIAQYWS